MEAMPPTTNYSGEGVMGFLGLWIEGEGEGLVAGVALER